jgi:3',5'-nucleoside bisphosphate phosphatase
MAQVDLHTHSWYSDGGSSPAGLVEGALARGIHTLAITDHDNARGAREALPLAAKLGLRLVTGIEWTCRWDASQAPPVSGEVDLLGYDLDLNHPALLEAEAAALEDARQRAVYRCAGLTAAGYPVSLEDVLAVNPRYPSGIGIVLAVRAKGYAPDWESSLRLADAHRDGLPLPALSIERAIEIIHAAGGAAVLAHPTLVSWRGGELDAEGLRLLVDAGLDGVEVFHHRLDEAARGRFLALAECFDLVVTGGSDEHSNPNSFRRLGTQPVEPACVLALTRRAAQYRST